MSQNNITQSKGSESSPPPRRLWIVVVAIYASFLTYVIVGLLITLLGVGFDVGFITGFANFFITLPFTLFAVWIYRKTRLPSRFELPAAILVGLAGLLCVGALFFSY